MTTIDFETLREVKRRFPDVVLESGVSDSGNVFVKTSREDIFGLEVVGLNAMRQTETIRVADVIGSGTSDDGIHVLVLEAIESHKPKGDFFERFGQQLAEMHRGNASVRFGFEQDNFLGASRQPNPWTDGWTEFWAISRIGFQLKLARENGLGGSELQKLGDALIDRLGSLIDGSEQPALIHGDLWSGNWICDQRARPVLIDPAVYFANREAEFGMTTLFGGLPPVFYDAYHEAWPLADGWEDRVAIYRLYHLLNHLNLFGSSYLPQCVGILRRFK